MSLGQSAGSVVFGRPIDLTIQARLDNPLEEPSNCFSADIFQGDARFDSNRVRVEVKAGANPLEATVRIRSTATVTEPWAKVILRTTCGAKVSRQYDFLTDFVTDTSVNAINTAGTASTPNGRLPTVAAIQTDSPESILSLKPLTANQPNNRSIAAQSAKAANIKRPKAAVAANTKSSDIAPRITSSDNGASVATPPARTDKLQLSNKLTAKSSKPAIQSAKAADGKSRLKMETFDLADEHQVMLKMSSALLSPVASDTPVNAQALAQAAAVWRALNAKPEDVAADAQKLQATTAELQSVKDSAQKASLSLQERLRVAESKEFANPLVYGLIALLALCLAGLTWLALRLRKVSQPDYAWLQHASAENGADPRMEDELSGDRHYSKYPEVNAEAHAAGFTNTARLDKLGEKKLDLDIDTGTDTTANTTAAQPDEITFTLAPRHNRIVDAPVVPESLDSLMVFTLPVHKTTAPVNNNPMWPAQAPSATQTDTPAPLVITPTDAFMLPITTVSEAEAAQSRAQMRQELRGHADPVVLARPKANTLTMPDEPLNIDLDFSKIAPTEPHLSAEDARKDNSKEASHSKAKKARHTGSLPKSVHQLHPPTVPPLVSDLKSNLIDFESFANPPEVPPASRRH